MVRPFVYPSPVSSTQYVLRGYAGILYVPVPGYTGKNNEYAYACLVRENCKIGIIFVYISTSDERMRIQEFVNERSKIEGINKSPMIDRYDSPSASKV